MLSSVYGAVLSAASAADAGMCFLWCLNLSLSLGFSCVFISQAEALYTSVERVAAYTNLEKDGFHSEVDKQGGAADSAGVELHRVSVGVEPTGASGKLGD